MSGIKRKPKIGDRVLVFDKNSYAPTPGTIRHIGKLKGEGEYDSIWSDWDCKRKFFRNGWHGGRETQKYWTYNNYTDKDIFMFLLPEFIRLKDWKKEKEWEKEREKERKAYDPLSYESDCRCIAGCRCKQ